MCQVIVKHHLDFLLVSIYNIKLSQKSINSTLLCLSFTVTVTIPVTKSIPANNDKVPYLTYSWSLDIHSCFPEVGIKFGQVLPIA